MSSAGTDASKFVLPTTTSDFTPTAALVIETSSVFDYEALSGSAYKLSFDVTVTDGTTTATVAIEVPVSDIDDTAPSCNPNSYFATVQENTNSSNWSDHVLSFCLSY